MLKYDVVLLIREWLPSGNGVHAEVMMVRTRRESRNGPATIMIYPRSPGGSEILCNVGYKLNAGRSDCEPINADACTKGIVSSKMCSGWNLSAYNKDEHVYSLEGSCYRYACKDSDMAFVSDTDHSCAKCVDGMRTGVHPINKTCVRCEVGKIFNENDAANNYCSVAVGLTKTDMVYGLNKTKNSNPVVSKQCWTVKDSSLYKECVKNGGAVEDTTEVIYSTDKDQ